MASNDAPHLVMESYAAGKDKFNAGGTIKDVVDYVHGEEDENKSMSFAMGFVDGLLALIRGKLRAIPPLGGSDDN